MLQNVYFPGVVLGLFYNFTLSHKGTFGYKAAKRRRFWQQ
jgi:hypothetical protein